MAVQVFTRTGAKSATAVKLDKSIFAEEIKNHQLLKDAYLAYLAGGRTNLSHTKKRGEVSGGGAKPHRQKGTGRARAGSIRSPIWRGGGITFGPTGHENYSRKLNVNSKRKAIRQALSLLVSSNKLFVMEEFEVTDGKTKSAKDLLTKIGTTGRVLLVLASPKPSTKLAIRNLPSVVVTSSKYLNTYNLLNADFVVIDRPALVEITAWLGKEASRE